MVFQIQYYVNVNLNDKTLNIGQHHDMEYIAVVHCWRWAMHSDIAEACGGELGHLPLMWDALWPLAAQRWPGGLKLTNQLLENEGVGRTAEREGLTPNPSKRTEAPPLRSRAKGGAQSRCSKRNVVKWISQRPYTAKYPTTMGSERARLQHFDTSSLRL